MAPDDPAHSGDFFEIDLATLGSYSLGEPARLVFPSNRSSFAPFAVRLRACKGQDLQTLFICDELALLGDLKTGVIVNGGLLSSARLRLTFHCRAARSIWGI
jgi:hypothetical protein